LKLLACLRPEEIGRREEEVKINFVVPLLEALGHSRLRFEHKGKDIVLREGLPAAAAVVVETKRSAEPLDRHVDQLAGYALEERSLLAVLTNGEELRVYAPMWPGAASFADTLLRVVRRDALASPHEAFELAKVLSAESLASGEASRCVVEQQARIDGLRAGAEALREAARLRHERLAARLRAIQDESAALEREREELSVQLATVAREGAEAVRSLYAAIGTRPPASLAPAATGAAPSEDAAREPWTDDELFADAAKYQRRILEAFVQAGTRRMPLRELTRAIGLSPQQAWGALSAFTLPVKRGNKEPFLEIARAGGKARGESGADVAILEKHWDRVVRLYGGAR